MSHLTEVCERDEDINVKQMMTKFTLDSIASCGFGVDANALSSEEGTFVKMVIRFLFERYDF